MGLLKLQVFLIWDQKEKKSSEINFELDRETYREVGYKKKLTGIVSAYIGCEYF